MKGMWWMPFNVTNASHANGLAMGDNGERYLYELSAWFLLACAGMICCCLAAKYIHGKCHSREPYAQMSFQSGDELALKIGASQVEVEEENENSNMLGANREIENDEGHSTRIEMIEDDDHEF